jgi:hypothetical protein
MTKTDDRAFAANAVARRDRARNAAVRAYATSQENTPYVRHRCVEAAIAVAVTVANLPDVVGAAKMATLHRVFLTDEEAGLLIRTAFEAAGFEVTE